MSSSDSTNPNVTIIFSLPEDYEPPLDGEGETCVTVYTSNTTTPTKIAQSVYPRLYSSGFNFHFEHNYVDLSVKYRINISMTQNGVPLLVDLDYFVVVHRAPHRQVLHLSPIGRLYIQTQEPRINEPEQALTIAVQEHDTSSQLTQVDLSEEMAEAFYLEYDPDAVIPGKRYNLTGIENKYRSSISVYPDSVVLKPFRTT